jgi:hypothetical protein
MARSWLSFHGIECAVPILSIPCFECHLRCVLLIQSLRNRNLLTMSNLLYFVEADDSVSKPKGPCGAISQSHTKFVTLGKYLNAKRTLRLCLITMTIGYETSRQGREWSPWLSRTSFSSHVDIRTISQMCKPVAFR